MFTSLQNQNWKVIVSYVRLMQQLYNVWSWDSFIDMTTIEFEGKKFKTMTTPLLNRLRKNKHVK